MLFTNSGNFANKCMHPSYQVDKEYLVRARGEFSQATKEKMLEGINIDGGRYKFTDIVEGEKTGANQWFSVCLISGKNREVRKIFNYFDMEVSRLKKNKIRTNISSIHIRKRSNKTSNRERNFRAFTIWKKEIRRL